MSKFWTITLSIVACLGLVISSVQAVDEVPFEEGKSHPVASEGDAWVLVTKAATYKTVSEKVQVRPASHYFETIPAVYEAQEERIMVTPETKRARLIPATFKTEKIKRLVAEESFHFVTKEATYTWVEEQVAVAPAYSEPTFTPAQLKEVPERILTEPSRSEQIKVQCRPDQDGYSAVQMRDRYTNILRHELVKDATEGQRDIPARFATIRVKKLDTPASVEKVVIPAQYEEIEQQVLVTPAKLEYETIPAKYTTITKMVMTKPEGQKRIDVPAVYRTLTREVLDAPEQLVWRKISSSKCSDVAGLLNRYGSIPGAPALD